MSERVRLIRERVEDERATVLRFVGDDTRAAIMRTTERVIEIVEEVDRELAGRWITLQEAADESGYGYDTIQRYAKAIADGEDVGEPWTGMQVRRPAPGRPYEVQAGTVPLKPGRVA